MGHVVRDTDWCVIDIDTTNGSVFFQQRWLYHWEVAVPMAPWTQQEKRDFHNRADRSIWAAWSFRARFNVLGSSDFAMRRRGRPIPINLDIRWVTSNPHWNVTVTKIAPGQFRTSNVEWTARRINLDTQDFTTRVHDHGPGAPRTTQVPVAHEFGHAIGNTVVYGRGDEYHDHHAHTNDQASIMHTGHALRARHFDTIIETMNTMIPNTTFSVHSV